MSIELNRRARGIMFVRNDASNLPSILAEMNKTFEAFKAEHQAEVAALRKDVVQTEKVDRINAEISDLNKLINDVKATITALQVGGAGADATDPDIAAHSTAFNRFFRRGEEPANMRELEVKAKLTTQSDPDGGYLVPTQTEAGIDRVLGVVSAIRAISRVVQVSSNQYKKLVSMGGAGAGWVGEEQARPETGTPTLREILIAMGEIYANPAATQGLLDDAAFDVEAWLAEEVSISFAEQEGAAFVSGNGVNKPRGFLNYDTIANAQYAWGKLGFIATGAAADFGGVPVDNLIDLYYSLKAGYRTGAIFVTSDAILAKARKWKDGDGNLIWAPPTVDMPDSILGKSVVTDDNMPNVAANAFPFAFGNFQRGYLIADRIGIRILRDPYTNKPHVHFYTTKRVGGGVVNFEAIKLLKCST